MNISPEAAEFYKRGWMDAMRSIYSGEELQKRFEEMFGDWNFEPLVKEELKKNDKPTG